MQYLILTVFFLLGLVNQVKQTFSVYRLSNCVPSHPCDRHFVSLVRFSNLFDAIQRLLCTEKSDLVLVVSLTHDGKPAETAPELGMELEFDLFDVVGLPG